MKNDEEGSVVGKILYVTCWTLCAWLAYAHIWPLCGLTIDETVATWAMRVCITIYWIFALVSIYEALTSGNSDGWELVTIGLALIYSIGVWFKVMTPLLLWGNAIVFGCLAVCMTWGIVCKVTGWSTTSSRKNQVEATDTE